NVVSCTDRSATTLGATTTAPVSGATGVSALMWNTTSTSWPRGVTESTAPTFTPSTCTSDPGYTPTARLKYAVIRKVPGLANTYHSPAAAISTSAASRAPTRNPVLFIWHLPAGLAQCRDS